MPLPRSIAALVVTCGIIGIVGACGGGGGDGGGSTGPVTGGISGSVTTGTEPVVGATVALSGAASRTTTTGATGAFGFTALAPGAYTVSVGLPGSFALATGQSGTRNATVVAGQTATVAWTAQRVTTGGGGDGGGTGGGGDNIVVVHLNGTSFLPPTIDVPTGTTVRWIVDNGVHTVTANNEAQAGSWTDSGTLSGSQVFEHTFTYAGTFAYRCTIHAGVGMVGTVRVQ